MVKLFSRDMQGFIRPANFIYFYAVGLLLFILPFTRDIFISITSLSLWLVFVLVFSLHRPWNLQTVSLFIFIILSSFLLEMKGVSSGTIFGDYRYDRGLGWGVHQTPLIIGFNWLFLVYASNGWARKISRNPIIIVISGALLMIGYDIILEWVAPFMRMWSFENGYPPVSNFTVWFLAGLIYHTGMQVFSINTDNPAAQMLFVIQLFFFICIGLYSVLFLV